jgi:hypothetical protein
VQQAEDLGAADEPLYAFAGEPAAWWRAATAPAALPRLGSVSSDATADLASTDELMALMSSMNL